MIGNSCKGGFGNTVKFTVLNNVTPFFNVQRVNLFEGCLCRKVQKSVQKTFVRVYWLLKMRKQMISSWMLFWSFLPRKKWQKSSISFAFSIFCLILWLGQKVHELLWHLLHGYEEKRSRDFLKKVEKCVICKCFRLFWNSGRNVDFLTGISLQANRKFETTLFGV